MFSDDELSNITPDHVYRFLALQSYHKEDPTPDDNPVHARSNSVEYTKKAISYYLPNKNIKWTVLQGVGHGNPTQSTKVNELIAAIKLKETRGLGKPTQMDRAQSSRKSGVCDK